MKRVGHKTSDTFHDFLMKKATENNLKMEAENKMKNSRIFDYDKMKKAQYNMIDNKRKKKLKDDSNDDDEDFVAETVSEENQSGLSGNSKTQSSVDSAGSDIS